MIVQNILSIPPYHYVHVLDLNSNVQTLVLGPKSYVCKEHERFTCKPMKMISLSPMEYCVIKNPVVTENGVPVVDSDGQVKLRMGECEYRFHQDSFPLYPNEEMYGDMEILPVVLADSALRLKARCDYMDNDGTERKAGDEWLFEGPGVYYPRMEAEYIGMMRAHMVELNTALRFRAIRDCVDRSGTRRKAGEHWLVTTVGAYLPTVYEQYIVTVMAQKLDVSTAVHVRSIQTHEDCFGKIRRCGAEWLVTQRDTDSYLCDLNEELVSIVQATALTASQYCIIMNPVDSGGQPQLGKKRLVRGEASLFLMPGESLECGIQQIYTLGPNDGLVLRATRTTYDETNSSEETTNKIVSLFANTLCLPEWLRMKLPRGRP
ncbi:hypothetical protein P879_10378 [Paragonimus westermani]|uniref:Major vault protein n=1 Tax=Paragonimus westermani TaxID=34504 RepID=A0A8T0D6W5_9TREM|nr:hypothetical protein P879_10378 [Paragonimus westermani]